ncbi:MAG TPA: response regulator transcription factor, partial [Candidatus Wallbacteria bacterium]|nr:response regulator transcription factor [Candidatus Wallbacteria bacterium]
QSDEANKIMGFDLGADDYLCKPFSIKELVARVRVVIRRVTGAAMPKMCEYKGLKINFDLCEVFCDGVKVKLSYIEFQILKVLIENQNKVVVRDELIKKVWNDIFIEPKTLNPHVSRLRKKLSPYEELIQTIPNVGYLFKNI